MIAVILGLMDFLPFLFFRKWVMSSNFCDCKADGFCAIFAQEVSDGCPVIFVNPGLMDSMSFVFFSE